MKSKYKVRTSWADVRVGVVDSMQCVITKRHVCSCRLLAHNAWPTRATLRSLRVVSIVARSTGFARRGEGMAFAAVVFLVAQWTLYSL